MRLVRFTVKGETVIRTAVEEGGEFHEISGDVFGPYEKTGMKFDPKEVQLKAPVSPTKIVAIGLNYRDHAKEVGMELPEEPLMFFKPPSSVIGPMDPIVSPRLSKRVDYEAELAVIIGKRAKNVKRAEAANFILGYTCLNDVTARDYQEKDLQWTRAKGFDTFCPIGPAIETDLDPSDISVTSWLNGEKRQDSRTSQLVFDPATLIEHVSSVMTLEPGDVIATGTPSGIAPMAPGDTIEIRIQGIGSLINPVTGDSI